MTRPARPGRARSPLRAVTFGGNCEAGSWSRKRSTATIRSTTHGVVLEHAAVSDVQQERRSGDLAGDRLADVVVGVELGRVAAMLVAGEELRVLLGAGRVLTGHPAQSSRISLACSRVPDRAQASSIEYSDATASAVEESISFCGQRTRLLHPRARRTVLLELAGRIGRAGGASPSSTSAAGRGRRTDFSRGGCAAWRGWTSPRRWWRPRGAATLGANTATTLAGEPIPFEQGRSTSASPICVLPSRTGRAAHRPGRGDEAGLQARRVWSSSSSTTRSTR